MAGYKRIILGLMESTYDYVTGFGSPTEVVF